MENERQCIIPLHKPSLKELTFFFISGIVVSIPFALVFEQLSLVSVTLSLVILAPLIEELAKVFPLFYRHGETERSIVTLGILIGLGFGIVEFFEYVLAGAPVIASIPHIIFHASSPAITSYGIAKKNPLPYYLMAVMFHVGINFFALSRALDFGFLVQLLILVIVYLLAWRFYQRSSPEKIVV